MPLTSTHSGFTKLRQLLKLKEKPKGNGIGFFFGSGFPAMPLDHEVILRAFWKPTNILNTIPCRVLSKATVIQLNLQCTLLVIEVLDLLCVTLSLSIFL